MSLHQSGGMRLGDSGLFKHYTIEVLRLDSSGTNLGPNQVPTLDTNLEYVPRDVSARITSTSQLLPHSPTLPLPHSLTPPLPTPHSAFPTPRSPHPLAGERSFRCTADGYKQVQYNGAVSILK